MRETLGELCLAGAVVAPLLGATVSAAGGRTPGRGQRVAAGLGWVSALLALATAGLVALRGPLVVLRTFSKLFGIAGLRLGYAIVQGELHWVWLRWRVRSGNRRDDPTCVTRGVNAPVLLCQVEGEVLGPVSVRTHGS